jgi:hypothetical protein
MRVLKAFHDPIPFQLSIVSDSILIRIHQRAEISHKSKRKRRMEVKMNDYSGTNTISMHKILSEETAIMVL